MYIGGVDAAGLHHLVWEIVDNSVDEAMNGHADRITVTLHKDGASATVTDNGRGIPVDLHAQYKKPALELILTTLHAGGKFEAKSYYHSGGLHGVGASVVNALSRQAGRAREARRRRVGADVRARQGRPGRSRSSAPARGSGTTIFFRPDPQIFPSTPLRPEASSRERLEATAYLHGGLTIELRDEAAGTSDDLPLRGRPARVPREARARDGRRAAGAARSSRIQKEQDGVHVECALAWTEDTERARAVVRQRHPHHRRAARTRTGSGPASSRRCATTSTTHNLVPRGLTIAAEDVREGLVALLAIKIAQPQFQGQTKERLNNAEVTPVDRRHRAHRARERAQRQPHGRRRDREPRHPGRAGAQRVARGGAAGAAQERRLAPPEPARASSPTAARPIRASASSSSSRATPPAARPSRAATAASRRSCRCAARC